MAQENQTKLKLNRKLKLKMFLTFLTFIVLENLIDRFIVNSFLREGLITNKGELIISIGITFFVALFIALLLFSRNLPYYYYKTLYKWFIGLILIFYLLLPILLGGNSRDYAYFTIIRLFLLYFCIHIITSSKINLGDSFKLIKK
jgi:hypothetical protein